ncbi:DUF559 domain-containing protein [Candidatus Uhrbacteria bacterium]|nr:DUF559 domain-containing protein [Candidatus Uhrbacteria bacterium]
MKYNESTNLCERRLLKVNQTYTEHLMWQRLRAKRFHGLRFRRQYGIGKYVVDFYCAGKRIVIEIDGEYHNVSRSIRRYDQDRQCRIEALGIVFLRFSNEDVCRNIDSVLRDIYKASRL